MVTEESGRRTRLYEAILGCTPDFVYVFGASTARVLYANESLVVVETRSQDTIGKTSSRMPNQTLARRASHCREIDRTTKAPHSR